MPKTVIVEDKFKLVIDYNDEGKIIPSLPHVTTLSELLKVAYDAHICSKVSMKPTPGGGPEDWTYVVSKVGPPPDLVNTRIRLDKDDYLFVSATAIDLRLSELTKYQAVRAKMLELIKQYSAVKVTADW